MVASRRIVAIGLAHCLADSLVLCLVLCLPLCVAGCSKGDGGGDAPGESTAFKETPSVVTFKDVTEEARLLFLHVHGGEGRRHLPETMGGGAAWFDLEGDGDLDVFLVQSGSLPDAKAPKKVTNGLFRNDGDGTFTDVTAASGAAQYTGYGQGVTAGDYDGDGLADLFVMTYGRDVLLRNRGDGGFDDVTEKSGIDNREWSCSGAFFDMDADSDLDLIVVNYVRFSLDDYREMAKGREGFLGYPHPDRFRAAPDVLYRNNGDGTFTDVTLAAGIKDVDGKGLGVAAVDMDGDADLDLYISNDSTPNQLYRNNGDGTFRDITAESNTGYNADGSTEAGMGIGVADVDGDLRVDLFVTNLDAETNTLYRNLGDLMFDDETSRRGLSVSSKTFVGFGTGFIDMDLDGDPDLLIGNGHVIDNILEMDPTSGSTYRERCLAYDNRGDGVFVELDDRTPDCFRVERVVRGAAFADYDDDGDVDVLLVQNDAPAVLIRNDHPRVGRFLSLRVVDEAGHDVFGARCRYRVAGKERLAISLPSGSYASSSDPRMLLSVPQGRVEEMTIVWPGGHEVVLTDQEPDRFLVVGPTGLR